MGGPTHRHRMSLLPITVVLMVLTACVDSDTRDDTLRLAEGVVQISFGFGAADPTSHTLDVEVVMPVGTKLDISFPLPMAPPW